MVKARDTEVPNFVRDIEYACFDKSMDKIVLPPILDLSLIHI